MPVVFIEPRPKGYPEDSPIDNYSVGTSARNVLITFTSQKPVIDWAKEQGHAPLVALARHPHKGNR